MCDIWKNRVTNELKPHEFFALPSSLEDINITGGEPFLRRDLVEIIKNIKKASPQARLIMNTNGFLPHQAKKMLPAIHTIDPTFALRVSLDGMEAVHDNIRRIPGGFNKALQTIKIAQLTGFRDVGVSFTVLDQNINEISKMQKFCKKHSLEFSLTVATNSVIYFGKEKELLRPKNPANLEKRLQEVAREHYHRMTPKEIMRGWFVSRLLDYTKTGKRPLPCDAGSGFFYMDSVGNIYTCHLKPWIMGNIRKNSFEEIFCINHFASNVVRCNGCWMVCTAKSMMEKKILRVASRALIEGVQSNFS
jgi:MoaA/NifB/PqqE/SkfB family radical SAM enzyme